MPKKSDAPEKEKEETTEPTPPDTSAAATQTDEKDWKESYQGLQRVVSRKDKELEDLKEKYDALLEKSEDASVNERKLQTDLEAAKEELEKHQSEMDNLTGQLAVHEAKAARTDLILDEYPGLASFEAKGLLPSVDDSDEDALRKKLAAFEEALGETIKAGVQKQVTGVGPADTGGGAPKPTRSKNELYAIITTLAGTRDPVEKAKYEAAKAEWDQLVEAELTAT